MSKHKRYPSWLSVTQRWGSEHLGRWMKRQLSKARRRYAKMTLKYGRGKEPVGKERETNWKGW